MDGPVGGLREERETFELVREGEVVTRFPLSGALTEVDVTRVRELAGVAVDLDRDWSAPAGVARVVCGLAAAGSPSWPGRASAGAGCSARSWRRCWTAPARRTCRTPAPRAVQHPAAAGGARDARHGGPVAADRGERGVRPPDPRSVSVLLCTRRPEMVAFALGQVARQRGVETEVILTLHGVPAGLPEVSEATAAYPGPITVVEEDGGRVFGEVLNRAARRASGTYLAKMDDDDWYGPDHLSDLVLALRYSGADLVGAAGEFYYLEPLGITVRRSVDSELYSGHVAGSSILISRAAFDGVGGFRPIPGRWTASCWSRSPRPAAGSTAPTVSTTSSAAARWRATPGGSRSTPSCRTTAVSGGGSTRTR
nr:hypothetical protein GCM10020093_089600 [Planobispora longispora]